VCRRREWDELSRLACLPACLRELWYTAAVIDGAEVEGCFGWIGLAGSSAGDGGSAAGDGGILGIVRRSMKHHSQEECETL